MLMWLVVAWSFLIPLVVPANNAVLAVGFFMAFFGLLFSGGLEPITYMNNIYGSGVTPIFCGIVSVTRYFIETLTVQEQRALPEQSGFTVVETSVNFPIDQVGSFALVGLAQNDSSAVRQSYNGWYWGILPSLWVGLTIRVVAGGILHVSDRSKQARKSLWFDITRKPRCRNRDCCGCCGFVAIMIFMFIISIVVINLDYGYSGVLPAPRTEQEAEELANLILEESFEGSNETLPEGFFNNSEFFNDTDSNIFNETDSENTTSFNFTF